MSFKKGEITTYIEDIPMKVSESFRPKKFVTSVFVIPDLKSIDASDLVYSFKTELFALEVAELKKEKDEETLRKEMETKKVEADEDEVRANGSSETTSVNTNNMCEPECKTENQARSDQTTHVVPSSFSSHTQLHSDQQNQGILKPEQSQFSLSASNTFVPARAINPADFEISSSSPFDDALLRAIDDKQELNRVFQQFYTSHKPASSHNAASPASVLHMNGVNIRNNIVVENMLPNFAQTPNYYRQPPPTTSFSSSYVPLYTNGSVYIPESFPLRSSKSTPDLKTYEPSKQSTSDRSQTPPLQMNVVNTCDAKSFPEENSQKQLSSEIHSLVNSITKMGFERSRVARAAKQLGPDEKKVFEFLFKVQDLEEKGFKSEDAELALIVNNFDVENAKCFLINLRQLCEVGFQRDVVIDSLVKFNNDRDLALDDLLSNQ